MKKVTVLFILLTVICTVSVAQIDTSNKVSIEKYKLGDSEYAKVIYFNGSPFTRSRKELLKLFDSPAIVPQPGNDSVLIYKVYYFSFLPYGIAIQNPKGFWEYVPRTSLLPEVQKYYMGIILTFRDNDNIFEIIRTEEEGQSRWKIHKGNQSDY